jgi:putative membrane protein insertion efficiency factor
MCAGVSRETEAGGAGEHEAAPDLDRSATGSPVSRETEGSSSPHSNPVPGALGWLLLLPLRGYRRWISPALPPRCRYYPSCSAYAEQALRELGPFKGTVVAFWRVLRCNPLSSGGLDPLENRRLFRSGNPTEPSPRAPKAI